MITFYRATNDLVRKIHVLADRYPRDVFIESHEKNNNTITICDGVPVILKHYGFDNQFRIEIGSYLSDAISSREYLTIEIS